MIFTRTRALLPALGLALVLAHAVPAASESGNEADHSERMNASPGLRAWVWDTSRAGAERARRRAPRPPHLRAWRCIHRHEGSWRDPGAPYYGGLQMDLAFQRTYGRRLLARKGTANRWTPLEQMWVAEKAFRAGRGFHPWPTAARRCGLI